MALRTNRGSCASLSSNTNLPKPAATHPSSVWLSPRLNPASSRADQTSLPAFTRALTPDTGSRSLYGHVARKMHCLQCRNSRSASTSLLLPHLLCACHLMHQLQSMRSCEALSVTSLFAYHVLWLSSFLSSRDVMSGSLYLLCLTSSIYLSLIPAF